MLAHINGDADLMKNVVVQLIYQDGSIFNDQVAKV
jgi:hypothetical protein